MIQLTFIEISKMNEIKEKRAYFVLTCIIGYIFISIGIFHFIFGSYENSNVEQRIGFFFADLFFMVIFCAISIYVSEQLYDK